MSIATLKKLVEPPKRPTKVGSPERWKQIEKSLGLRFPRDYRDFVRTYGAELFAGLYYVHSPFARDYRRTITEACDLLREQQEYDGPDSVPHPIYPEAGGLLPWGGDENGNRYYWLTEGAPTKWPVVQNESRGSGFTTHPCGLVAFFTGIMQRTIPALASGYPPIILRCPIESCAGWVHGGIGVPWYCEACNYEWESRDEINEAIAEIISAYPYRNACYNVDSGNFLPANRKNEPPNYGQLVAAELDD